MTFAASANPVKVGVVGLGRFGRLHALTLAGLAEAVIQKELERADADLLARLLSELEG